MNDYGKILFELELIKAQVATIDMTAKTIDGWIPRKAVMKFFDIGDTTMTTYENTGQLEFTKVGKRKFYSASSIAELLNKNIVSK